MKLNYDDKDDLLNFIKLLDRRERFDKWRKFWLIICLVTFIVLFIASVYVLIA